MAPQPQLSASDRDEQKREEERSTLRYWLANEDVYTSAYVRKWLERTPPEEAADTLTLLAQAARPDPHSVLWMMFHALTAMLTTAEIISENSPAGRKAGIRAAILLADLKDPRALPPLARVIETHWFWEGKYQAAIETALLRLLSSASQTTDWTPYRSELRKVVEDFWNAGHGRKDLTSKRADLVIAAISHLAASSTPDELAFLKIIGSATSLPPSRSRVKDAAVSLLG